ncbi:TrmB family transcriptional regulator [Escherichia coli]|uniref:TrmB family transcriptional regulator n=1 Tax=Escherichia coli TaxID=562 RepID=UPI002022DB6E|nr:TrmB family transcriptional regulator [Escherichia coli]
MLKQQDMTETARVVFNELSVTEPATAGEIAQNTYLSRERCQLILTQLVMAGLADPAICSCVGVTSKPQAHLLCAKAV